VTLDVRNLLTDSNEKTTKKLNPSEMELVNAEGTVINSGDDSYTRSSRIPLCFICYILLSGENVIAVLLSRERHGFKNNS
jgi:hypothetical protein